MMEVKWIFVFLRRRFGVCIEREGTEENHDRKKEVISERKILSSRSVSRGHRHLQVKFRFATAITAIQHSLQATRRLQIAYLHFLQNYPLYFYRCIYKSTIYKYELHYYIVSTILY